VAALRPSADVPEFAHRAVGRGGGLRRADARASVARPRAAPGGGRRCASSRRAARSYLSSTASRSRSIACSSGTGTRGARRRFPTGGSRS
jgi:hypothetical protein